MIFCISCDKRSGTGFHVKHSIRIRADSTERSLNVSFSSVPFDSSFGPLLKIDIRYVIFAPAKAYRINS